MEYKVVRHPKNTTCDPKVMLARTVEEALAGEIQTALIVTINKEGVAEVVWSDQTHADLCYCLVTLQTVIQRRLIGEDI